MLVKLHWHKSVITSHLYQFAQKQKWLHILFLFRSADLARANIFFKTSLSFDIVNLTEKINKSLLNKQNLISQKISHMENLDTENFYLQIWVIYNERRSRKPETEQFLHTVPGGSPHFLIFNYPVLKRSWKTVSHSEEINSLFSVTYKLFENNSILRWGTLEIQVFPGVWIFAVMGQCPSVLLDHHSITVFSPSGNQCWNKFIDFTDSLSFLPRWSVRVNSIKQGLRRCLFTRKLTSTEDSLFNKDLPAVVRGNGVFSVYLKARCNHWPWGERTVTSS